MDFIRTPTSLRVENGAVHTNSRMRMWWLTSVRGFEVARVTVQPHRYVMGQLRYVHNWVLTPRNN